MATLPLEIRNAGAALSILGQSCDYFQQFRELTENVIDQARSHPEWTVTCRWSYDENIYKNGLTFGDLSIPTGTLKIACVDDGPGMDEATLTGPIRSLFNSGTGHDQGNFGIGAKVAGLSENAGNSLGMFFITKQAGKPATCALLTRTGLAQIEVMCDDGPELWAVLPCAALGIEVPKLIQKAGHGTAVILLGDDPRQHTVKPSLDVWEALSGKKIVWLPQYLIRRYSSFPANFQLKGFEVGAISGSGELYDTNGNNKTPVTQRPVRGFDEFLNDFNQQHGTIPLDGATAKWYILGDKLNEKTLTGHMMDAKDRSGMAVEYCGELYEREPAVNLGKFGIYTNERKVFIKIIPDEKSVAPNATRDSLYIQGKPLHAGRIRDWATDFREKVKDTELGAWLSRQGQKQSGDARNRMIEMLRQMGASLKISGFQLKKGDVNVTPAQAGAPAVNPDKAGASHTEISGKGKGESSQNLPVMIDPRGQMIGSPSNTDCAPDIQWKDAADFEMGIRQAGKYALSGENPLGVLILNKDYKFFGELRKMLYHNALNYSASKDFTEEQLLTICQNLVEYVMQCDLAECVLRAYLNAKVLGSQWNQDQLDELFTPTFLSASCLRSSSTVPKMVEMFRHSAKEWLNVN